MRTSANGFSETTPIEISIDNVTDRFDGILTESARQKMTARSIPDLEELCNRLNATFTENRAPYSALQFLPVMQDLSAFESGETARLLTHPETSHVLVHNDLLKVVLIHWPAGKISSIHGHPEGGCVFNVLQGTLVEKRYRAHDSRSLLSESRLKPGSMAYIDDRMGYHSVGNLSTEPAISVHAYTPGRKPTQVHSARDHGLKSLNFSS